MDHVKEELIDILSRLETGHSNTEVVSDTIVPFDIHERVPGGYRSALEREISDAYAKLFKSRKDTKETALAFALVTTSDLMTVEQRYCGHKTSYSKILEKISEQGNMGSLTEFELILVRELLDPSQLNKKKRKQGFNGEKLKARRWIESNKRVVLDSLKTIHFLYTRCLNETNPIKRTQSAASVYSVQGTYNEHDIRRLLDVYAELRPPHESQLTRLIELCSTSFEDRSEYAFEAWRLLSRLNLKAEQRVQREKAYVKLEAMLALRITECAEDKEDSEVIMLDILKSTFRTEELRFLSLKNAANTALNKIRARQRTVEQPEYPTGVYTKLRPKELTDMIEKAKQYYDARDEKAFMLIKRITSSEIPEYLEHERQMFLEYLEEMIVDGVVKEQARSPRPSLQKAVEEISAIKEKRVFSWIDTEKMTLETTKRYAEMIQERKNEEWFNSLSWDDHNEAKLKRLGERMLDAFAAGSRKAIILLQTIRNMELNPRQDEKREELYKEAEALLGGIIADAEMGNGLRNYPMGVYETAKSMFRVLNLRPLIYAEIVDNARAEIEESFNTDRQKDVTVLRNLFDIRNTYTPTSSREYYLEHMYKISSIEVAKGNPAAYGLMREMSEKRLNRRLRKRREKLFRDLEIELGERIAGEHLLQGIDHDEMKLVETLKSLFEEHKITYLNRGNVYSAAQSYIVKVRSKQPAKLDH